MDVAGKAPRSPRHPSLRSPYVLSFLNRISDHEQAIAAIDRSTGTWGDHPSSARVELRCFEVSRGDASGLNTRYHVSTVGHSLEYSYKFAGLKVLVYSAVGAVMTPLPKNSLIVPNLSRLRCRAS